MLKLDLLSNTNTKLKPKITEKSTQCTAIVAGEVFVHEQ